MARVELLTDRLVGALPDDFDTAAKVLWQTLESPTFTGWMTLPCGSYVARAGIDLPRSPYGCSPGSHPAGPTKDPSAPS